MAGNRNLQATVEDCHSTDESDHDSGVNESFRRSPAAASGQANVGANVAARRSQPSDLNGEREPLAEKVANIDLQSDSGYSSHTAATMSSADSGPSAKSHSPQTAPATATPPPSASPAGKRRPTLSSRDDRHNSSENSTRKPLARSGSVSSRNRPRRERQSSTTNPCTDPNCDQCPGSRGRRPKPSPLDSGVNVSYNHPFDDQRSQRSDPAPSTTSYASPQSPTYPRQPGAYFHGSTVVLPAQTSRPRRSSSVARPVSFAGEPSQGYWAGMPPPAQYPPQAHEPHGPPPAMSAYHNVPLPHMGAYGMLGASPSNGGFYAPPPMPMHNPHYDMQRPPMHSRTSSNFNARRPASQVYGQPPVLAQDPGNMPSARYPPNVPSSATQRYFPRLQHGHDDDDDDDDEDDDDEDSSSASDSSEDEDTRRALMPPPKSKPSAQRQPSHQQSSSRSERRKSLMSQSLTLEPERESRRSRVSTTAAPSRSASKARPRPTTLVHQPKAQSAFETSRPAKVTVEDSRSRRRQSYQGQVYEKEYRDERRQRVYPDRPSSKVYRDQDEDADVIVPRQRRRPTDPSLRNEVPTSSKLRDVANDVEAYQQRTRGSDAPLNDHIHRAAKRGSRIISGPSEAGSSRSKGSDKASRVSQSARTTVTNGGGGELRLRVDGSARLQFNGDMEGRTLQICPGEDGMAEIVIADNRGHESAYRSDRGSVLDRKTVVSRTERMERSERPERSERARREAEEVSTRSSRSSQSRRDRERDVETRPLRRREKLYRE